MKCDMAQQSMVLASYGELPDDQAILLERHLQDCDECRQELAEVKAMFASLETRPMIEVDANLLAQSRMRLDEALDQIPSHSFMAQLRTNLFRWVGTLQGAPALATLLLGVGFLGGNAVHRYQDDHHPKPVPGPMLLSDETNSTISNISGIVQTSNPDIVQVLYNRVVPESMEGSPNDPQIRKLLVLGLRAAATNGVRTDSASVLATGCRSGQGCKGDSGDGKAVRAALMVSLRTDKSADVRLKALDGLESYVGQDRRVRDAVLEALMHDSSAQVRSEAIGLLLPVQADSSVRQVLRTVSTTDDNPHIRTASYQALQGEDSIQ